MAYFVSLFTPETYEGFTRSSRDTSGFPATQSKTAQKVRAGDILVCYMTKLSRWIGALKVVSGPFEDDTPIFTAEVDRYIVRFRVEPLVWLPKEQGVPIQAAELWDRLSFTRNLPQGSTAWTGKVRRSLVGLSREDGDLLLSTLRGQETTPTDYPLDLEQYERYLPKQVQRPEGPVAVVVPVGEPSTTDEHAANPAEGPRESYRVQAQLAKVGEKMGFSIWLPRSDRAAVRDLWSPKPGTQLDRLPLNYDDVTLQTVEQIDVLWLRGRSIVRAFEVEHTTAVYSGILRMADLLALQPNMDIKLHIVAPVHRKEKVMAEIRRPVFSLLEKGALATFCTFISYDSLNELATVKHLSYLSDSVLDEYIEEAG